MSLCGQFFTYQLISRSFLGGTWHAGSRAFTSWQSNRGYSRFQRNEVILYTIVTPYQVAHFFHFCQRQFNHIPSPFRTRRKGRQRKRCTGVLCLAHSWGEERPIRPFADVLNPLDYLSCLHYWNKQRTSRNISHYNIERVSANFEHSPKTHWTGGRPPPERWYMIRRTPLFSERGHVMDLHKKQCEPFKLNPTSTGHTFLQQCRSSRSIVFW